jgi:hypothetical protein
MIADDLLEIELLEATQGGEVIEDYPNAFPFPACLVLGHVTPSLPVHLVWAFDATRDYSVLVTVYCPDPSRWSDDFRKRVKHG